jgi:hypothetical protein
VIVMANDGNWISRGKLTCLCVKFVHLIKACDL